MAASSTLLNTLNRFETQLLQNLSPRAREARQIQVKLEDMLMTSLKTQENPISKKRKKKIPKGKLPYRELRYQGSAFEGETEIACHIYRMFK